MLHDSEWIVAASCCHCVCQWNSVGSYAHISAQSLKSQLSRSTFQEFVCLKLKLNECLFHPLFFPSILCQLVKCVSATSCILFQLLHSTRMGKGKAVADAACKFCKLRFHVDTNPLVKNPDKNDTLKPRCSNARDCRPCANFIKNEEEYADMTASALEKYLQDTANQKVYDEKFKEWCATRREGGRRARNRGVCLQNRKL